MTIDAKTEYPQIHWVEKDEPRSARWHSEAGNLPPKRVILADDKVPAESAYRLACEGTGLLWKGDFQNARQLLQAMTRRLNKARAKKVREPSSITEAFHWHRQDQIQRARILGMLLISLDEKLVVKLRRAPDVKAAFEQVHGKAEGHSVVSLRELQGVVGAYEWRKAGVFIPALETEIHPHYGVYSPIRGEYLELIEQAPLPEGLEEAVDVGVGTGVLTALLLKRGVKKVTATDLDPRALACAKENLSRMGMMHKVELQQTNLYPTDERQFGLIVCNPPWVPASANAPIEHAVYDPNSRMLKGFLSGLKARLTCDGEGWLILSDLAEHLGLRSRDELLGWVAQAGLHVLDKLDVAPKHSKAFDSTDVLHEARSKEVTSLWRLAIK